MNTQKVLLYVFIALSIVLSGGIIFIISEYVIGEDKSIDEIHDISSGSFNKSLECKTIGDEEKSKLLKQCALNKDCKIEGYITNSMYSKKRDTCILLETIIYKDGNQFYSIRDILSGKSLASLYYYKDSRNVACEGANEYFYEYDLANKAFENCKISIDADLSLTKH